MNEVVLATRSAGKLRELRPLFADAGVRVIDLDEAGVARSADEQGIEVFSTFEENALAKARYYFARAGGRPVVADDSGLEVEALGGRPGVWSKRWSGRTDLESDEEIDAANNAKLVAALDGERLRRARYVCVAAYIAPSTELVRRGEVSGSIVDTPRGSGGFGYDPYFYVDELGKTFGEASLREKAAVSHRGRAFRALLDVLSTVDRRPGPGYF